MTFPQVKSTQGLEWNVPAQIADFHSAFSLKYFLQLPLSPIFNVIWRLLKAIFPSPFFLSCPQPATLHSQGLSLVIHLTSAGLRGGKFLFPKFPYPMGETYVFSWKGCFTTTKARSLPISLYPAIQCQVSFCDSAKKKDAMGLTCIFKLYEFVHVEFLLLLQI